MRINLDITEAGSIEFLRKNLPKLKDKTDILKQIDLNFFGKLDKSKIISNGATDKNYVWNLKMNQLQILFKSTEWLNNNFLDFLMCVVNKMDPTDKYNFIDVFVDCDTNYDSIIDRVQETNKKYVQILETAADQTDIRVKK